MTLEIPDALGWRTVKRRERRAPAAGRDLQVASTDGLRGRWDLSTRAGGREVKRHKCRAPDAEFGERFPRVVAPRLSGADRQPWADGFESRWDSLDGAPAPVEVRLI
jgi:hypothetical protein